MITTRTDLSVSTDESTRKAGRPSIAQAGRIRESILDAALDAFVELGYGDATIDGIALRAQTTRRSIIHRFPTKENLLMAVVERQIEIVMKNTEVREEESNDLLEVMRSAFRRLLDYFLSPASLGYARLVIHEVPRIAEIGTRSIAWNESLVASYIRLILRAQEAGHFRRYSAHTLANMAVGVMLSNPINRALFGDPAFVDSHRIDLYFSEMWAIFLTMA